MCLKGILHECPVLKFIKRVRKIDKSGGLPEFFFIIFLYKEYNNFNNTGHKC